jgi:hypothetical protein
MTYTSGSLIEAADYNGFVSTNANANINDIWSVGSSDKGYGESAVANVSAQTDIAAPNWATLVNRITSIANHTGTTITSRSAPVTGDLIQILANVNTDLTNCTTNRGNAVASGTQYTAWTGTSGKTGTTSGVNSTIVFNHTITFASANAARYFFNAGGRIKWQVGKSSTGNQGDPEWNDLAGTLSGSIFFTGRVNGQTANIASTSYTGTTKSGGTGTPNILTTTTGYYQLTTSNTILYKQFADSAPYTTNYIQLEAKTGNTGVTLDLTTTWFNAEGDTFSGGTAPSGVTFGTAPATIVTYFPPSSTYLTGNAWGTPTVAAVTT